MTDTNSTVQRYPFYRAEGTHRHLGQQHGEQAREHIRAHLDFMCASMKLTREQLRARALRYQPLFEKHCRHLVEEIRGLGEGAGVEFADALATNVRGALSATFDGGCTAFAVSGRGMSEGQVLIGQNSDMLPAMIDMAYVLHFKPEDKPEVLMWTFGGMIGYHGINSHGVGQFANDLGGGPKPTFAIPHYPLKRIMLECKTLGEIEQLVQRVAPGSNGNYVLSDSREQISDIEATTEGSYVVGDNGSGFIAHSNHYLCPEHGTPENFEQSAADSFSRLDRMSQLIQSRFGELGVDDFKSFLRDRDNHPTSICRTAQTDDMMADWTTSGITVASIIAEPKKRQLHVAVGNQAETPFEVYRMEKS